MLKQFSALRDSSWQVVDASQPIDAIQQQLQALAAAAVERCRQGEPLRALWDGAPLQHQPGEQDASDGQRGN